MSQDYELYKQICVFLIPSYLTDEMVDFKV